jgi:hypothetical protein
MEDLDPANDQSPPLDQGMEIEALSYPKDHLVNPERAKLTMAGGASKLGLSMPKFWKWPRFWIGLLLILWLGYILSGNLETAVTLWVVPLWVHPVVRLSWIIFGSAVFGAGLTLLIQFAMRRRSSKYASASAAAPASSSNTAA